MPGPLDFSNRIIFVIHWEVQRTWPCSDLPTSPPSPLHFPLLPLGASSLLSITSTSCISQTQWFETLATLRTLRTRCRQGGASPIPCIYYQLRVREVHCWTLSCPDALKRLEWINEVSELCSYTDSISYLARLEGPVSSHLGTYSSETWVANSSWPVPS